MCVCVCVYVCVCVCVSVCARDGKDFAFCMLSACARPVCDVHAHVCVCFQYFVSFWYSTVFSVLCFQCVCAPSACVFSVFCVHSTLRVCILCCVLRVCKCFQYSALCVFSTMLCVLFSTMLCVFSVLAYSGPRPPVQ